MLHAVDTKLDYACDALIVRGMGGDGQTMAMALVNDRSELFVCELKRVVASHNLDQISAAAHLLAHGAAHRPRQKPRGAQ